MKFGCLEPSKIMFDFWNVLLVERHLTQFVRVPPYEILVFLTNLILFRWNEVILWDEKRTALSQTHSWEKLSFFFKYSPNRVKTSESLDQKIWSKKSKIESCHTNFVSTFPGLETFVRCKPLVLSNSGLDLGPVENPSLRKLLPTILASLWSRQPSSRRKWLVACVPLLEIWDRHQKVAGRCHFQCHWL